jgi:hypothetical protein
MTRGSYLPTARGYERRSRDVQTKEAAMASLNQQTSPHGAGSSYRRWVAIAIAVALVAIGVVLLVLYGGGGSGGPGY